VLTTLDHREPDRVPIDIGGGLCSISQFAYRKLLCHLGWEEEIVIGGLLTQVVKPSPRMLAYLGSDFIHVTAGPPDLKLGRNLQGSPDDPFEAYVAGEGPQHTFMDEWGVVWRRSAYYYDMIGFPMIEAKSLEDLERYRFPDPRDPGRVRGLGERCRAAREAGFAVTFDPLAGGILEMASSIRGHSNFYMDMATNPEFAEELLDRITDFFEAFYEEVLNAAGEFIDIVLFGDDYGMQSGLIISPQLWRMMIKPRLRRLIQKIKGLANVRYQHHSCGAIAPILPDLVEIGVDILNPLQPSAKGMDLAQIKLTYGDALVMHGAIDQQSTLPHGTPLQVQQEVETRLRDLAPGGGYIAAVSPNIQADVPPENILALYRNLQDLGGYPILANRIKAHQNR
jgi:uroporphyrinogen decarboxylase